MSLNRYHYDAPIRIWQKLQQQPLVPTSSDYNTESHYLVCTLGT